MGMTIYKMTPSSIGLSTVMAVIVLVDGIFKPSTLDKNGRPQGICFKNNGDKLVFLNLNGAKGMTPEAIGKNMDKDLSLFDCSLPGFDTSEHNEWLAAGRK